MLELLFSSISFTLTVFSLDGVAPVKVFAFFTVISLGVIEAHETGPAKIVTASWIRYIYVTITVTRHATRSIYYVRIAIVTRSASVELGNKNEQKE
jgi:hypothetical protein